MRFFAFDRVIVAERGKRLTAVKAFSLMDGYLGDHYPRRPVLPGSLVVEALAQVGGMLNLLNHDFAVEMVLMLVDGVRFADPPPQGEPLTLEVRMRYDHPYGATMDGVATADGRPVATVGRLVFAHEDAPDPSVVARNRQRYAYQAGALR
jgi:3-hydroxymyristoyl/3-hydroxydecanoyl-(acyl carrier protein) dehydratase